MENKMEQKAFDTPLRNCFHMTFPNGLTASITWGAGTYSDNHCPMDMIFDPNYRRSSNTAEVAVLDKDGDFVDISNFIEDAVDDCVAGYLDVHQVLEFLNKVATYKT